MVDIGDSGIDLGSVLEAMSGGAYLFDPQGKLLSVNREGMRICGFRSFAEAADEIEGRSEKLHVERLGTAQPATPRYWIQRALAGEPITEDLARLDPVDGKPSVIVRASFKPVRNGDGEIVAVLKTVHDVTLEYDLERRKNEFVCVTMHELRTPATALRLRAQSLRRATPPSADQLCEAADAIDRATRRIERIAVKLQDIATIAAGEAIALQPTRLRLDALIADVVESLEPEQAQRIRATTLPAEVRADGTRVREVVQALLDNALRYSEAPASVDVKLHRRDGIVELSVADQGIGIPQAKQPHLFEQFYRAHAGTRFDRGGLGASLYLADHIVKQHGGRIWFESAERRGSTFYVAFTPAVGGS
jgi:two-component system phosphate regulon sensor histidine kinase PhoR